MLVEVKKQIPGTPARRARRHALSSFDQLNKAERERLGKINPLHKRYNLYIIQSSILERAMIFFFGECNGTFCISHPSCGLYRIQKSISVLNMWGCKDTTL